MNDLVKVLFIALGGLIGAAIPLTGFYLIWSWCMAQIPATLAYAGLAKICVSLGLFMVGGGVTIWLTIVFAGFFGVTIAAILDIV